MSQTAIVFEDSGWKGLYPITLSRPTFDCRVGVTTLGRRLAGQLAREDHKRVGYLCRTMLRPLTEKEYTGHGVNREIEGDVLFLNGRLIALGDSLKDLIYMLEKAVAVQINGELAGARVTGASAIAYGRALAKALEEDAPAPFPSDHSVAAAPEGLRLATFPWDLVTWNTEVLKDDFEWIHHAPYQRNPELAPGAQILKRDHILCREDVKVEAGAILDAGGGPIFLGEGSHILHNAVILGPAYVGPASTVKIGAKLEGGVSLGPGCKVGGEVEASILQGYANKQHDGFLGHAYLGAWTNLGAGTNNSDLKNNYSSVRVWTPQGMTDTGQQFVGLFMGDHSKCAIGTQFNTGTTVGFSCNVFGAGFPPKHIPSFSWGGAEASEAFDPEKALALARAVMLRRKINMEAADEVLFRQIQESVGTLEGGAALG